MFFAFIFELILLVAIIVMFICEDDLIAFEDRFFEKVKGDFPHDRKVSHQ